MRNSERYSRRSFLKQAAAGVASTSILGHSVGHACFDREAWKEHLPPGILHCRDRAIRLLYIQEMTSIPCDEWGSIGYRMRSEINGYYDSVVVKPWSRNIEPALHMFSEQLEYRYNARHINNSRPSGPSLDVDSPQMLAFQDGLADYFDVHRRTDYYKGYYGSYGVHGNLSGYESAVRRTEDRLIHSIAYATYEDEPTAEERAQEYIDASLRGRARIVAEMQEKFLKMGDGDIESREPRDSYNRRLVGAWGALILGYHYHRLDPRRTEERDMLLSLRTELERVGHIVWSGGDPTFRYL